jgi:hypothetical protein
MRRLLIVVFLFAGALPAASAYARAGYAIPPDNPFVGTPGARGEVYVYGLRNPWRWSFDPGTGGMFIGDVGAGRREEVTFLPGAASRGANLGWNCREGSFAGNRCRPENYFPPTYEFRSGPDVVIGGYVVRDPALPSFAGRYLYGRYESGIYALGPRASGKAIKTQARIESMTSLGEDALGRLHATSYNGAVYRLAETGGSLALTKIGEFARPVSVVSPPGDAGQLFIVEKRGRVQLLAGGQVTEFLDITRRVREKGYEEGLLGVAFAPDYASSGRVFAYYTNKAGNLQLDEYAYNAGGPNRVDVSTRKQVLTIRHQRSDSHNGGGLLFGPDGNLYLSTGDGDVTGDPDGDAQDLGSLLGKILRLDVGLTASHSLDTTAPALRARVKGRQDVLHLRGAIAYARCPESCSVAARGMLRIAGRVLRLRTVATVAGPGRATRLKLLLTASGRRALEHGLGGRRPISIRLTLRARDSSGNRSSPVARKVTIRR